LGSVALNAKPSRWENDMLQPTETLPNRIVNTAYLFRQSKVLFVAAQLDVFDFLAEGPLDLETLTARSGIHPRGARDFFDALVALGLLDRDSKGRYANTSESDCYLVRGKPAYIGGLLRHLDERHYENWDRLCRALITGEPQSALGTKDYSGFYAVERMQQLFLEGMSASSLIAAHSLAAQFPWSRYRTFIDIGTAQGCVPVEIARAHPHLRGGGFDLPEIDPAFTSYVASQQLSDRLTFYPGDFFADPLPQADVLIMGRILHNWGVSSRVALVEKAYQALTPGGALIVYDPLIDDTRREPAGLLSSLNMLIETANGSEYTAADCRGWMANAGFSEQRVMPLGDVHAAVIGKKKVEC
jgi:SAM-dependent methyltransferase